MAKQNWIEGAIKKPGSLRAKAKRAGAMTKADTIDPAWLRSQCKSGNRAACLAETLRKMPKRGK